MSVLNRCRVLRPVWCTGLPCVAVAWSALFLAGSGLAQDGEADPDAAAASETAVAVETVTDPTAYVTVNWGEEIVQGGLTIVALGLLSVLLLVFAIERLIVLRPRRFAPRELADEVEPLFLKGDYAAIRERCKATPSTLARVIAYMVDHRRAEPMLLGQAAGDLGAREMADQEAKTVPFAVIAALAPLLGLLGTMIGMIEAFALVEVFGDEGGASMLAGSISKALITTAVGLILAIPAIALYHWFKHRVHQMTQTLEGEVDRLFSAWFVRGGARPAAKAAAPTTASSTSSGQPAKHRPTPRPAPDPNAPRKPAARAASPKP